MNKKIYEHLNANWPEAGSSEVFAAMREVIRTTAQQYLAKDIANHVSRLARGDIRMAIGQAISLGVPSEALLSPILLLIGTAKTRKAPHEHSFPDEPGFYDA